MSYSDRVKLYAKLLHHFAETEAIVGNLKLDLQRAFDNTDYNFPEKRQNLEDKIKDIQQIEDIVSQLSVDIYDFRI